jgi:recombination protein RecR
LSDPLARLVGELLLKVPAADCRALADAIIEVTEKLFYCSVCNSITDVEPCRICTDPQRDPSLLCVVEEPFNITPVERTGEFRGRYHVLMGALSPQHGVGPEQLRLAGLLDRLGGVEEVIVATNPSVEGEATALYLARLLKPKEVKVTRLAFGMPVGGDIEYTDEVTLARSLAGRREI